MSLVQRCFAATYPSESVTEFVKESRHVVGKMGNSTYFTHLSALIGQTAIHTDTLESAHLKAHNGPKGGAAVRDPALLVVRGDMRLLKSNVQLAADADVTHAKEIIESAGMYVFTQGKKGKGSFAVKYAGPSTARLDAKAFTGQGTYHWQMNAGSEWADLPPTVTASCTVGGLTPVTLYSFRFRTFTKDGYSDWSAPVTFIAR